MKPPPSKVIEAKVIDMPPAVQQAISRNLQEGRLSVVKRMRRRLDETEATWRRVRAAYAAIIVAVMVQIVLFFAILIPDREPAKPPSAADLVGVWDASHRLDDIYRVTITQDRQGVVTAEWVRISTGRVEYVGTITVEPVGWFGRCWRETYRYGVGLSRCEPWTWHGDRAALEDNGQGWTLRRLEMD